MDMPKYGEMLSDVAWERAPSEVHTLSCAFYWLSTLLPSGVRSSQVSDWPRVGEHQSALQSGEWYISGDTIVIVNTPRNKELMPRSLLTLL